MTTPSSETAQQHYELMYIIPVRFTAEEVPAVNEKIKAVLAEHGCALTYEDTMGKRRLAYPIDGVYHGYYFMVEFDMDPTQMKSLETALRLMPEVLRHLIISQAVRSSEEIAQEKERREHSNSRAAARRAEQNGEGQEAPTTSTLPKVEIESKKKPAAVAAPVESPEQPADKADAQPDDAPAEKKPADAPADDKVNITELDKKLDELIDESII